MPEDDFETTGWNALADDLSNGLVRERFVVQSFPYEVIVSDRVQDERLVEGQHAMFSWVQFLVRASVGKIASQGTGWQIASHSLVGARETRHQTMIAILDHPRPWKQTSALQTLHGRRLVSSVDAVCVVLRPMHRITGKSTTRIDALIVESSTSGWCGTHPKVLVGIKDGDSMKRDGFTGRRLQLSGIQLWNSDKRL
ncbi:MAG: hypothetical protein FD138_154 [Planctomycetota bacterium]|nr:MAG: hypothetical protein FD138_154 [Planctomycetota bacterium]